MLNFEERKNQHSLRLLENIEILGAITPTDKATPQQQKTFRMLVMPVDEKELDFAEAYLSMFTNMRLIVERALTEETKIPAIKDNAFAKFMVMSMNTLKNRESIQDKCKEMTPEDVAQLLYDMSVIVGSDPEELEEYLSNNIEADLSNELEMLQIKAVMREQLSVNELTQGNSDGENMEKTIKMAKELDRLVEENKINTDEDDKGIQY